MRAALRKGLIMATAALSLFGCGGGGGGGGNTQSSNGSNGQNTTVASAFSGAANAHRISVKSFAPSPRANTLLTSVTLCSPGGGNCQTIDNILVDTGSTGLRIMESVIDGNLGLSGVTSGGDVVHECVSFADNTLLWGPVKTADVRLANQTASSISIQVVSAATTPDSPAGCGGAAARTPAELGANGILGIGTLKNDCGSACSVVANNNYYFGCTRIGCNGVTVALDQQVSNPIAAFPTHNNGSLIRLPAVPLAGTISVEGELLLGINTASNNTLGTAKTFPADTFTTRYKGVDYPGFIDSGTGAIFFADSLTLCANRQSYCPASTTALSAINIAASGLQDAVSFSIVNADGADASLTAAPGLGASTNALYFGFANDFLWGLPFFYGRPVFTALEDTALTASSGPFFAY